MKGTNQRPRWAGLRKNISLIHKKACWDLFFDSMNLFFIANHAVVVKTSGPLLHTEHTTHAACTHCCIHAHTHTHTRMAETGFSTNSFNKSNCSSR